MVKFFSSRSWNTKGFYDAYLSFMWASRLLLFSLDGCIMILSLKCERSHWTVKKVFLNVQNIRTDDFNLVKSLKIPVNEFIFLLKINAHKDFFQILLTIFQRYCLLLTTHTLRDTSYSVSVSSRLDLIQLSSFVKSKE